MAGDSRDEYEVLMNYLRQNIGVVVENPDAESERLLLSSGRNTPNKDEHEHVIEAAFWVRDDRPKGSSKYKTFILRGLESMSGGHSAVSDGSYAETRDEAIAWLEEKATEFDGGSLNWEEREHESVTMGELMESESY